MSNKILAAVTGALLLGPIAAHATIVDGSFSGTMSSGTDTTGVFGTPGADLTSDAITGTFTYDTSLFSQSISGGTNTATGSPGALTVTVTINGFSHTFTDNTSSSIYLDANASEVTLANDTTVPGSINENFYLDVSDLFSPFISSTDLTAPYTDTNPFSSNGTFFISDIGPNVTAGGAFTLGTLSVAPVPEPASLGLLAMSLGGIAVRRTRRSRRSAQG
jgi:hypothetical protein